MRLGRAPQAVIRSGDALLALKAARDTLVAGNELVFWALQTSRVTEGVSGAAGRALVERGAGGARRSALLAGV